MSNSSLEERLDVLVEYQKKHPRLVAKDIPAELLAEVSSMAKSYLGIWLNQSQSRTQDFTLPFTIPLLDNHNLDSVIQALAKGLNGERLDGVSALREMVLMTMSELSATKASLSVKEITDMERVLFLSLIRINGLIPKAYYFDTLSRLNPNSESIRRLMSLQDVAVDKRKNQIHEDS